jgi:hypothetical protein
MPEYSRHPASFKDPSGFIFQSNGKIYRQVNQSYAEEYDWLIQSGLYSQLVSANMLIGHEEISHDISITPDRYKVLLPSQIQWISYPYEWCFGQLKDAALLTLAIMRKALDHQMILKDASSYNIQFYNGYPVLIDSLSFEKYVSSQPWSAYRQFCEYFLFPLYLHHFLKSDAHKILQGLHYGIPVDLVSSLLPFGSKRSLGVWMHVHLQKALLKPKKANSGSSSFSKVKLLRLITNLENIIQDIQVNKTVRTEWHNYYEQLISGGNYLSEKEKIFREICESISVRHALDLGANDGYFSKILAEKNVDVVAIDGDGHCINQLYEYIRKQSITNILPLVVDIANPSAAAGFSNKERLPFFERIRTELVIALAIVHHLAIAKNIPLTLLAEFFNDIAHLLIIEFVPKEDPKVREMLMSRKDVFSEYDERTFELSFNQYFNTRKKISVPGTQRTMYLMKRK